VTSSIGTSTQLDDAVMGDRKHAMRNARVDTRAARETGKGREHCLRVANHESGNRMPREAHRRMKVPRPLERAITRFCRGHWRPGQVDEAPKRFMDVAKWTVERGFLSEFDAPRRREVRDHTIVVPQHELNASGEPSAPRAEGVDDRWLHASASVDEVAEDDEPLGLSRVNHALKASKRVRKDHLRHWYTEATECRFFTNVEVCDQQRLSPRPPDGALGT
jgi:hypothetical protein